MLTHLRKVILAAYFHVRICGDGVQQITNVNMASYTADYSMFTEVLKIPKHNCAYNLIFIPPVRILFKI